MNKLLEYFKKDNFKELEEYISTHLDEPEVIELKAVIKEYTEQNDEKEKFIWSIWLFK